VSTGPESTRPGSTGPASTEPASTGAGYDEFGLLHENAAEAGLPFDRAPAVARHTFTLTGGQQVSAIHWHSALPELVLLHGGGQNAHTWDTVALALGRPLIAVDLPGHGHSGRRPDRDYGPVRNAEAVAAVLDQVHRRWPGRGLVVVGMSLGGVTAIRLAAVRPDLVRRLVVVDVTPQAHERHGQMARADQGAVALVTGPPAFDSFEQMAAAAAAASPRRPRSAVERGVRHNARQLPDGRWTWRYDLFDRPDGLTDFAALWADVASLTMPVMLVRGGDSKFVADADAQRFLDLLPAGRIETVPESGHAVQSDQPLALTRLIVDFALS
jgi:pimeloyl-ACP methyl ester carboxylesterase